MSALAVEELRRDQSAEQHWKEVSDPKKLKLVEALMFLTAPVLSIEEKAKK